MKKLGYIFLLVSFLIKAQTQVVIGPQSSTFSGMVRGYHFTAPTNFNLCALYIPQDANTGVQNIAVVQFNTAAPPAFPGTTNAFTTLFSLTNIAPGTTVAVNIPMTAGTIYGIYGARNTGCVNSYDGTNYVANIAGFPATLSRSGMQACLNATPMANIWSEVNFSIGRIFMYYNCCPTPTITTAASATNICNTTSVTILGGGATTYTWMPGNINTPSITVSPSVTTTYTLSGSALGCTGTNTVGITVNATPTISSVSNSGPVCEGSPLTFSVNTTTAGTTTYSWTGPSFSSNQQNPVIPTAATANNGTYSVSVTNSFANGAACSASGTTTAAVVAVAALTVAPVTATVCENSNVNFSADATGASSYTWTGPSSFGSSTQNPQLTNVTPLNSGDYSVTAFFTNPGTTLVCSSSAVSNLSVVPRNPVNVNATPDVCQYGLASLSATAAGASGYQWIGPNNFTSSASSNTITNIQPASTGPYFVDAIFSIGSVSCSTSGSANINVVPVSSITVNPPVSVCVPDNVALSANASGAVNYLWQGPNSFTSAIANPVLTAPPVSASGVYTVTSSFNNGALTCFNSNTTQVTVNPILTFTLPPYNMACYSSLFTVPGPAGATSYTWTSSNGFTSNTQDLTIPGIQTNQAGHYTLTVNLGPCTTKAETEVEVLSPIVFTLAPQSRTICYGDTLHMVIGSQGGSQNYAYQWIPPVFLGSPTGSIATGIPVGTTIYNIIGYDIACPQYSVNHTFTVQVNQPPRPDLQLDRTSGCQPLCIFYDTKTSQEAAITTYDFGGILKMQADSFTYCLEEPGTYNLKITSKGKNGCYGVYDYPEPIIVYPTPHTLLYHDPEIPSTTNNIVTFNPTHGYGPVVTYEWMFQGAFASPSYDTSSAKNPVRVYDNVGKYPVMLISTTDQGCKDTVFKVLDIFDEMAVYIPNTFTPNGDNLNDIFNIRGAGLIVEGFSMEIFDRWGTVVYSTKDILKGWDGTIKGQQAAEGVYIYKVKIIGANGEGKKEYIGHVTLLK